MAKFPYTQGPALHVAADEQIDFDTPHEAVQALRWVRDQGAVEAVFPCGWLVDVGCEDGSWIVPCGNVAVGTARGWECYGGHAHVTAEARFEEGWDYVDADDVEAMRSGAFLPTFLPVNMDGTAVAW